MALLDLSWMAKVFANLSLMMLKKSSVNKYYLSELVCFSHFDWCGTKTIRTMGTRVPYKHKKVRNFFRHFRTEILRILAFFLPPKTGDFVSRQKP